jgi:UDP-glucose 4-epimerase
LTPIIYGDGQQTRDFVSVSDAVDAILLSMSSDNKISSLTPAPHVLNIGSGKSISINDLAETMIRISGLDLQPLYKE